jgi:hypothetical protein
MKMNFHLFIVERWKLWSQMLTNATRQRDCADDAGNVRYRGKQGAKTAMQITLLTPKKQRTKQWLPGFAVIAAWFHGYPTAACVRNAASFMRQNRKETTIYGVTPASKLTGDVAYAVVSATTNTCNLTTRKMTALNTNGKFLGTVEGVTCTAGLTKTTSPISYNFSARTAIKLKRFTENVLQPITRSSTD